MTPETINYLIEITVERRNQAAAFFHNGEHLSPQTREHWRRELQRAENALASLSTLPIS